MMTLCINNSFQVKGKLPLEQCHYFDLLIYVNEAKFVPFWLSFLRHHIRPILVCCTRTGPVKAALGLALASRQLLFCRKSKRFSLLIIYFKVFTAPFTSK